MPSRIGKFFDGLVGVFSPERGIRRIAMRRRLSVVEELGDQLDRRQRDRGLSGGGFQSAEKSRDAASWLTSRLSPDSALEQDRDEMLLRASSALKNFELAVNHREGRAIRVAGCGMTVKPMVVADADAQITAEQAKSLNKAFRVAWEWTACRIGSHGQELWELQQEMQRDWEARGEWILLVGDEFDPLTPTTLKVERINPDRVSTPPDKAGDMTVRMGVQLDAKGRGIGLYIRESQPGDTLDVKWKWTFYPYLLKNGLPRVIHHFARIEAGQHRGYPLMQVGTKRLKNSEEYGEAELERNFVAACNTAFVHSELNVDESMTQSGVVTDASGKRVREMAPGLVAYLGIADSVEFNQPSGPSGTFGPFMEHEGRQFAAGCGSAYEIVSGDWSKVTFAGGKIIWAVEDAATVVLQMGHKKTIWAIYCHFVNRMIVNGLVDVDQVLYRTYPMAFSDCRVIAPPRASIDLSRDLRTELMKVEAGLLPAGDIAEQINGRPSDEVYDAIQADNKERTDHELPLHMPMMGGSTQPGDTNPQSSDANSDRQAVVA